MTLATARTLSRRRRSSTTACSAASVAVWVTTTSEASSPWPSWRTVRSETSWVGEHLRDGGEHAGLVGDVEAHVVPRDDLAHRADPQVGVGRVARAARSGDGVARDGDQVAEDGAGRRGSPGAGAVEHQPPALAASTKTAL
jgi:hypothetical protein